MIRSNSFRLEEFLRKWAWMLSAPIAGEEPKESARRLGQLDYGKALSDYQSVEKARREEAKKRAKELADAAQTAKPTPGGGADEGDREGVRGAHRLRYAPPIGAGRALSSKDACPTLFRYPGPLGLGALLEGHASALGPSDAPYLWLADKPLRTDEGGAEAFGVAVVLQPLSFSPAKTKDRGIYLGINRIALPGTVAYLPPPLLGKRLAYDRLRDADDLARRGEGLRRPRRRGARRALLLLDLRPRPRGRPGPARPVARRLAAAAEEAPLQLRREGAMDALSPTTAPLSPPARIRRHAESQRPYVPLLEAHAAALVDGASGRTGEATRRLLSLREALPEQPVLPAAPPRRAPLARY